MNVSEALKNRKSCRAFKPDAVDRETLLSILSDARCAPSLGKHAALGDLYRGW